MGIANTGMKVSDAKNGASSAPAKSPKKASKSEAGTARITAIESDLLKTRSHR